MKHTLALVTTVGLITFCVFNILHQQTKTVRNLPSDTLGTHKTSAPSKKKNVNVLDIYAKNMKKRIVFPDNEKSLDESGQKDPTVQKANDAAEFYSRIPTFITELVKEAANLSHKLFR